MEPNKSIEENNNNQLKQSTWDGDKMMSMAAIFISVLTMFALIYQSYLARVENEMMRVQQSASVLPYLDSWYSELEGELSYVIINKGVGPAFVKEVKFTVTDPKSKDIQSFNTGHKLIAYMKQNSEFLASLSTTHNQFHANQLISPNEKVEYVIFPYNNENEKIQIHQEVNKFKRGYSIIYEDIYGARWELNSKRDAPIKLKKE